jgi:hypothetical protein
MAPLAARDDTRPLLGMPSVRSRRRLRRDPDRALPLCMFFFIFIKNFKNQINLGLVYPLQEILLYSNNKKKVICLANLLGYRR